MRTHALIAIPLFASSPCVILGATVWHGRHRTDTRALCNSARVATRCISVTYTAYKRAYTQSRYACTRARMRTYIPIHQDMFIGLAGPYTRNNAHMHTHTHQHSVAAMRCLHVRSIFRENIPNSGERNPHRIEMYTQIHIAYMQSRSRPPKKKTHTHTYELQCFCTRLKYTHRHQARRRTSRATAPKTTTTTHATEMMLAM